MCIGCYALPIMTLISPGPEAPPAATVPLIGSPDAQVMQVQPQMSVKEVRAEIAAMIQRLPDSADAQILREEFTAIHQRLEGVTDVSQANTVVGEGMLTIADRVSGNPNANRVIDLLYKFRGQIVKSKLLIPCLRVKIPGVGYRSAR